MTVSKAILEFLKPRKRGEPVCAKQLLHLGNRAAVDQALARLVRRKKLVRVSRGFYAVPARRRCCRQRLRSYDAGAFAPDLRDKRTDSHA